MMPVPMALGKQQAIDVHTARAEQFSDRYEVRLAEPYTDCFAYSRHRLNSFIERSLPAVGAGRTLLDVGSGFTRRTWPSEWMRCSRRLEEVLERVQALRAAGKLEVMTMGEMANYAASERAS